VILFSSSNPSLNSGFLDLITHKKFTLDSFNPIVISLSYCGEKNSHLFKGTKGKKKEEYENLHPILIYFFQTGKV
jgi:hypothetical protein